ncbi:hypothetical protein TNCV_4266761 [Trichonephila clavipes]|nr:hypothetical protein TNCV_4266761 [Trichonephila clavipes]
MERKTTAVDNRYIIPQTKRARLQSGSVITQQLYSNRVRSVAVYSGQGPSQRRSVTRRIWASVPLHGEFKMAPGLVSTTQQKQRWP